MDKQQQELLFKLSIFEQQISQLQQQLQAVEEGFSDLKILSLGLEKIKNSEGKEILAPLGRGIFVRGKMVSEDLIVDVGGKNMVKKTIPETQKIIETQIKKLGKIKQELDEKIEEINKELAQTLTEAGKKEI